MIKYLTLLFDP